MASEELDDRGDDEPVAILLDSIDFQLFRVERPVPPGPRPAEVAAEGGAAVLGRVGLAGLDRGDGLGLGGPPLGEAGGGVRVEADRQVSRPSSAR